MSEKNVDSKGRWRSKAVAFRATPQENEQINIMAKLCGMTKQDYITSRLLEREIIVKGNPRVYKALKERMELIYEELKRIQSQDEVSEELLATIQTIAQIMGGLKGGTSEK